MKKTYIFLGVFLALLVFVQIVKPAFVSTIRSTAVDICEIPLKAVNGLVKSVYNLASFQNRYENKINALEDKIQYLKKESVVTKELLEENERLRSLLSFKNKLRSKGIAAEVIGRDPSGWESFVIIDKGSSNGIRPDMPVTKSDGMVGIVVEAGRSTAKVMLLDNQNSKIGVIVQGSRDQGLLVGIGGGLCKVKYLSSDTTVKRGDVIVASGTSNKSLKGILVGNVVKVVKRPGELHASAIVKPSCNLFKIEEVLCLE